MILQFTTQWNYHKRKQRNSFRHALQQALQTSAPHPSSHPPPPFNPWAPPPPPPPPTAPAYVSPVANWSWQVPDFVVLDDEEHAKAFSFYISYFLSLCKLCLNNANPKKKYVVLLGAGPDVNGRAVNFDHFDQRKRTHMDNLNVCFAVANQLRTQDLRVNESSQLISNPGIHVSTNEHQTGFLLGSIGNDRDYKGWGLSFRDSKVGFDLDYLYKVKV
jgi:hypothetical protein